MKKYTITVNGTAYEVEVEEMGGVAAPKAATAAGAAAGAGAATGFSVFFCVGSTNWMIFIKTPKAANTPKTMVILMIEINQGLVVTGPIISPHSS